MAMQLDREWPPRPGCQVSGSTLIPHAHRLLGKDYFSQHHLQKGPTVILLLLFCCNEAGNPSVLCSCLCYQCSKEPWKKLPTALLASTKSSPATHSSLLVRCAGGAVMKRKVTNVQAEHCHKILQVLFLETLNT